MRPRSLITTKAIFSLKKRKDPQNFKEEDRLGKWQPVKLLCIEESNESNVP